ncbi:MAG TPA: IPTL-CTERM sorting domain-containing protein [Desulfatiglandales bacterium]|nr:IPTL-CTERM sorting domain-containing protein [Desulfatiglandales bacterium]
MKNVIPKLSFLVLLLLLMFVSTETASSAFTLFQESFESGVPPAGWTVVDNEGTGVEWTTIAGSGEDGNFTNGSGEAACVSSDKFGQEDFDTELRTPALDFTGLTGVKLITLRFTANYQNFAGRDFFDVDVSTDGGTSWTNIMSWNEDHGGFRATPGEDVSLSISALVGGQNNVVIRFHYYDPNDADWDWYVQVDDLLITAVSIPIVPAMSQWGMIIFMALLGMGAICYLRRREVHKNTRS